MEGPEDRRLRLPFLFELFVLRFPPLRFLYDFFEDLRLVYRGLLERLDFFPFFDPLRLAPAIPNDKSIYNNTVKKQTFLINCT